MEFSKENPQERHSHGAGCCSTKAPKQIIANVSQNIANPGPVGLLGFGMTTILLNIHNAGFMPLNVTIVSMGIFMGGIMQVIAGIMEFKNKNLFGATAFTCYGFFWLSLVGIWVFPHENSPAALLAGTDFSVGIYLGLWGIMTLGMTKAAMMHNKNTRVTFTTLTALFFLLSLGHLCGSHMILNIAGYVGIISGSSAMYGALAAVINNDHKRDVLPL